MLETWEDYFKLINTGSGLRYQYKDTSVIELPEGLPIPPNDYRISFNGCHKLIDISALSEWDISNLTTLEGMFNHCYSLEDISPISDWNTSNVTNMAYLFNCCRKLNDLSYIYHWDISKVTKMRFIFNGCRSLPDEARFDVNDPDKFSQFMDHFVTPILYPVFYEDVYEEEEEIFSEYPTEIANNGGILTETNKEVFRSLPEDDRSWLEQSLYIPLKVPSVSDYSDDQ